MSKDSAEAVLFASERAYCFWSRVYSVRLLFNSVDRVRALQHVG